MNQYQAHIGLLKLDLVFFDNLDLDGINPIVFRQFLVLSGLLAYVALFRAHIIEMVVKIFVGIDGIFLQEVVKIPLRIVMRGRKILCEKDVYSERLRECGHGLSARF